MTKRTFLAGWLAIFLMGVGCAAETGQALLKSAKTVVFLGDSITYAGSYVGDFVTWAELEFPKNKARWINVGLASETVSGLSEPDHAGGKFPRPDLHERLGRILEQTKPDLVFACYGMNCGIQLPLDEGRFAKYREGIFWLKGEVEKSGAKIIFLTPPYFDSLRAPEKSYYTDVLAAYSKWLLEQRANGWMVIDINESMTQAVKKKRREDPKFTFQPDAVHPNPAGHWVMAQTMIEWFGDKKSAAAVSPQAMIEEHKKNPALHGLVMKRMTVLRDAALTATKHKRPGVPAGKPMPEAEKIALELTDQIHALTL